MILQKVDSKMSVMISSSSASSGITKSTSPTHQGPHIVNRSFSRTPANAISIQDLKEIYSVLLCCLNLNDGSGKLPQTSSFFGIKRSKKSHPFSFTVDEGVKAMTYLSLELGLSTTSTKITYEIREELAAELLGIFFNSKLLHAPEDKTRINLQKSPGFLLQPTPKGVAVLHSFCQKLGFTNKQSLPLILKSNFNSMELICFERSSRTDKIIHNENWDKLMFAHMMGPNINVWEPTNTPDEIPNLGSTFDNGNPFSFGFDFTDFSSTDDNCHEKFIEYLKSKRLDDIKNAKLEATQNETSNTQKKKDIDNTISPFHHRFYTNPDSDSHVQYYVSKKGVRFFKNKVVEKSLGNKLILSHCVTGKAIIQYLLDCTDLMDKREAIKYAYNFLKMELLFLVADSEMAESSMFNPSKDALYCLTLDGLSLVRWSKQDTSKYSNIASVKSHSRNSAKTQKLTIGKDITLKDVLRDPGMKYLFKLHLKEEYCQENLDAYDDIVFLEKKVRQLKNLLKLNKSDKLESFATPTRRTKKLTVKAALVKLSNECISKSYSIYSTYICDGATNELNLDSILRQKLQSVMANPDSPTDYGECSLANLFALHKETVEITESKNVNTSSISFSNNSVKKSPKLLTIDTSLRAKESVSSPTIALIGPALSKLDRIEVLYSEVKAQVLKMMEQDSLTKFVSRKAYNYPF